MIWSTFKALRNTGVSWVKFWIPPQPPPPAPPHQLLEVLLLLGRLPLAEGAASVPDGAAGPAALTGPRARVTLRHGPHTPARRDEAGTGHHTLTQQRKTTSRLIAPHPHPPPHRK